MVTDRDRLVVAWVAVVGAASAQDVMARFGVGRTVAYRPLRTLVELGLLSRVRLVYGQPVLYVATRDGLAWRGCRSSSPHVSASPRPGTGRCARGSPWRSSAPTRRPWLSAGSIFVLSLSVA